MFGDISDSVEQLCAYLQECDGSTANTEDDTPNTISTDSSIGEIIPAVVGSTTECMESIKDDISMDHMYHKKTRSVKISLLPSTLSDMNSSIQSLVLPAVVMDNVPGEPESFPSVPTPDLLYTDSNWDMGSDGNKSPHSSDTSSLGSPYSTHDDLTFDWNESFTNLFPQLA